MKMFVRCCKINIKNAVISNFYKYVPVVLVSLFSCLQLWIKEEHSVLTWADYIFWLNKGMSFPKDNLSIIPNGVWIFFYAYLLAAAGSYLNRSDAGIGMSLLLKAGSRGVWILSKYITCVIMTVVYFLISYFTAGVFTAFLGRFGTESSGIVGDYADMTYVRNDWEFNVFDSMALQIICALALISIFFAAMNFLKQVFAYVICMSAVVYTIYTNVSIYPGNLLMFRRGCSFDARCIMSAVCIAVCVFGMVLSVKAFRRKNIA